MISIFDKCRVEASELLKGDIAISEVFKVLDDKYHFYSSYGNFYQWACRQGMVQPVRRRVNPYSKHHKGALSDE